ncbi:MAG: phosphatidylinositol kinase [Gammaproteobacteria bacterium RIFCSPHIGHO2_12_FULL_45_9]|nr:MAG: phosphatidylinositol kinase [Gammaproteobacteria bacterium RIFCSPHIGHO2_12_FULL_45_9]
MTKKKKTDPYKRVERIEVFLWDKFVGAVALDPKLDYYVFAYDKQFGKSGIEVSPLHMPLNDTEKLYIFTELPVATYKRLPAMLADALPDDFGNALIDRYMADNGIAPNQVTPLDRLAYMGKRAMGALEFKPTRGPRTQKPTALEMGSLVTEARKLLHGGSIQDDNHTRATLRSIIEVGTSAGGARAKAVIAWNPETHEIHSGQVETEPGFEHWLLKFDGMGADKELGPTQDYGRIEYAYYLMAIAAGITMPESRLLQENGRAHFMTKRFDRENKNIKHHMQTLCALNHLDYKKKATNSYEQLFMTIHQLSLGHNAYVEAFRRMVFNIMGRNCDDHTKNFSFLLRQDHGWELAPAYDISFAHNPEGEWTNQHLMSVNGKYNHFTRADILAVADRFGIGEATQVIRDIRSAITDWPSFAKTAAVTPKEIDRIRNLHVMLDT